MADHNDPANTRLQSGRSMADVMRPVAGMRLPGFVVSPGTEGGVPSDFDPHDRQNVRINVLNQDGSRNCEMALSTMSVEHTALAVEIAQHTVRGNTNEAIRERAAVAFEELAKMSKSGVKRVPVKKAAAANRPKPTQPSYLPGVDSGNVDNGNEEVELLQELSDAADALEPEQHSTPPVEKIDRNYSPMAAFGLKRAAPTHATPVLTSAQKVGAPQKLVYFEKEGIGTVPAFFHEVIVSVSREDPDIPEQSGFLVLVYDLRFDQNAARWFPPSNDPYSRPWAVQISDDRRLYLVHTTGFQYVYDNREYCVLMVERALIVPEPAPELEA